MKLPSPAIRHRASITAVAALCVVSLAACAQPSSVGSGDGPLYEGKTVEIIVPFGTGGGADLTARLVAPYLQKHLPGNPTVQVVNVEANGDHRVGTNDFAKADPDGTQLLMGSGSTHSAFLYKSPGVEYDLRDFTPLLGFPLGNVVYVNPDTGIGSADQLLKPTMQMFSGGREPVGGELYRVSSYHLLGLDVEELWGYGGQDAQGIAYSQGEINIAGETTPGFLQTVQPLVERGEATPVYTMGQVKDGELVRDPAFPDLPHVGEVYELLYGESIDTKGEELEAFKVQIGAALTLSKTLWVQGGASDEVQDALTAAAEDVATDPEFLTQAKSELGGYQPIYGAELDASIQENLVDVDPQAIDWLRNDVKQRYQLDLQ